MKNQLHEFDVCVVGGGMAGVCAAIAAARNGAKTAIVQDRPVFGGNASSEVRMHICGARGKENLETGILEDIQLENNYRNPSGNYSIWDSVLYGKIACEPNIRYFLNCACVDGETQGNADDRELLNIRCWQLTTQTWHTLAAKVFIDCSGDSILAPISQAQTRWGRESCDEFDENIQPSRPDRKTMGNSLLIQLRKTDSPQPFTAPDWAYRFDSPEDLPARIKGVNGANFWWIELGGLDDTIEDAESIRDELMRAAWGVWDYIKNRAPERDRAANWALEWLGSLPGKRENRRYVGDHILTQNEVGEGGRFKDIIAYGGWPMDDHHPAGLLYPGEPTLFHGAPSPYGIPYRSLYSRNVRNLLCAGRNISVTHAALSSTRVMATCAIIGQAAGTAAALAVRHDTRPRGITDVHLTELQATLMDDDAWLPGLCRPVDDLTNRATCEASGVLHNGYDRPIDANENLWCGKIGEPTEMTWPEATAIGGVRLVFDSNFSLNRRMPSQYPISGTRPTIPDTLAKSFRIEVRTHSGSWETVHRETDNHQRLVRLPIHAHGDGLRLVIEETWGVDEARVFGFDATRAHRDWTPKPSPRVPWRTAVSRVVSEDLAPPDSGLEQEALRTRFAGA